MARVHSDEEKREIGKRGFPPGTSGNPAGRPPIDPEVKEAAKAHTVAAIETLVDVMTNSANPNARVSAAVAILNRGWGQPKQTVDVDVSHSLDITAMLDALDKRDAAKAITQSETMPVVIEGTLIEEGLSIV